MVLVCGTILEKCTCKTHRNQSSRIQFRGIIINSSNNYMKKTSGSAHLHSSVYARLWDVPPGQTLHPHDPVQDEKKTIKTTISQHATCTGNCSQVAMVVAADIQFQTTHKRQSRPYTKVDNQNRATRIHQYATHVQKPLPSSRCLDATAQSQVLLTSSSVVLMRTSSG